MDKFTILTLLLVIMPVVADEEWIVYSERSDYMNHRNKRQAAASGNHEVNLGPANGYPMRAVTIMHEPFTSWNNDVKAFSGLVPDLFNIIAYRENIKFTMYEVKDGKFGAKKSDGSWSGMIGDVLDRQQATQGKTEDELKNINVGADIAGAALTMTSLRELHIDFINPFKHTGIVMTVKKINKEEFLPVNFRVTDPLSAEVWVICTAAIVLVALVMFAINQLDPYEWSGRYKLGRASELHAETFNLSGSLWFAFTTLQWQGYERAPRSVAGRILSVFWFTFITITLLTYTASLVNWLFRASTVHGKDYTSAPIPDLEHLVMSNRYKYGCVRGGSTYRYLTQNKGDIFSRINTYFKGEGKENLVNSTKQGFEKVRTEENYVFIGEELSALHEINKRPCDIAISGNTFAPRAYAMAYRSNLNRTIVDRLHKAILQMQEEGDLDALQKKWFVDKGECWNVSRVEKMTSQQTALALNNSPKKITLKEYSGPLVLIIVGIIVSVIAAVAETMYFKYKGRYQPGNRPGATQLKLEEDGQM